MGMMASQITSLIIVYSTVYSGADQRKHQSSASLAFVLGIHRGPGTGEFPAQMSSNAENVSICWRHHVNKRNNNFDTQNKLQYVVYKWRSFCLDPNDQISKNMRSLKGAEFCLIIIMFEWCTVIIIFDIFYKNFGCLSIQIWEIIAMIHTFYLTNLWLS